MPQASSRQGAAAQGQAAATQGGRRLPGRHRGRHGRRVQPGVGRTSAAAATTISTTAANATAAAAANVLSGCHERRAHELCDIQPLVV